MVSRYLEWQALRWSKAFGSCTIGRRFRRGEYARTKYCRGCPVFSPSVTQVRALLARATCNRYIGARGDAAAVSQPRHGGEQRAQAKEPSAKHRAAVAYLQQARPWWSSPSPLDLRLWFPSSAAFWDRRRRVLCDARALRRHRRLQPLRAHLPLPRDRVHHGLRPHLPTEHRLSAVLGGASSTHHSPLTTHRSALAEP